MFPVHCRRQPSDLCGNGKDGGVRSNILKPILRVSPNGKVSVGDDSGQLRKCDIGREQLIRLSLGDDAGRGGRKTRIA